MALPGVRISERELLIRSQQASGRYGAIQIQAERGPSVPVLVSNENQLLDLFTWNGVIPDLVANRSGYYSARNFLRNSDRLWVHRVVPAGATYAGAYCSIEETPEIIDLDLDQDLISGTPVTESTNIITQPDTFGFEVGEAVTVVGENLPDGLLNGQKYYLSKVAVGNYFELAFFDTEEHAIAHATLGETTGMVDIGGTDPGENGSGNLYLYRSEKAVLGGVSDLDNLVSIGSNAFVLTSANQGSWGNNLSVTVEVPRADEAGIICADEVDAETGEFPVSPSWFGVDEVNFGTPVVLLPATPTSVLPTKTGGVQILPTDVFYVVSSRSDRVKLAESMEEAVADTPTTITFSGDGNIGSGNIRIVPITTIALVNGITGVDYVNNRLTTRDLGDNVTSLIKHLSPIYFTGDVLPSPLQVGTLYYAIRLSGNYLKVASSLANAIAGNAISLSDILTPSTTFNVFCLPTDTGALTFGTSVVDIAETVSIAFSGGVDFTANTFTVPSGSVWPDGTPVRLPDVAAMITNIVQGTVYYVRDATATTFKLAATVGGAAIDLVDNASTGSITVEVAYIETIAQSSKVNTTTNRIEVVGSFFRAGMTVQVSSSVTLPTGLAAATDYVLTNRSGTVSPWTFQLLDTNGDLVDISAVGSGNMTITVQDPFVDPNYISLGQQIRTGTPLKLVKGTGNALPAVSGTALDDETVYYAIDATPNNTATFRVQLARTKEAAYSGEAIDFDGNTGANTFYLEIQNVTPHDVNLDGAIDYAADTIRLNLHSGVYQQWVPGEQVRVTPVGSSVLPTGISSSSTLFVVPVGDGKIKLARLSGNALTGADKLSIINLSSDSGKKGSGSFTISPAFAPLEANTFRIKVWRKAYRRSAVAATVAEYSLLEELVCSVYENLQDGNGRNLFLEQRLLNSKYVRGVAMAADIDNPVKIKAVPFLQPLGGGLNDDTVGNTGTITSSDLVLSLSVFTDKTSYPVSYFMDGGYTFSEYQLALLSLAASRKDSISILSTPQEFEDASDPVRAIIDYKNTQLASSSFGALFTPWQLTFDAAAGRDILTPPDGFVAAKMSEVDSSKGPWVAASGLENGGIKSKGGRLVLTQAQLDDLANNGINPIIRIAGSGPTIWGNDTLLGYASPTSRINVRKLVNEIQTELGRILLPFISAPIDSQTYARITTLVQAYLRRIQGQRGLTDSKVVCDSTNNTADDANSETINVWVYIKPITVARFIDVITIVTPAGVDFNIENFDI